MSSRSNGVMNELLTLRMISWVASSAACSMSRIRSATASRSDVVDPEELGQLAASRRRGGCADVANRS